MVQWAKEEDADSTVDTSTLNETDRGNNDIGRIEDYWYNAEEGIDANFLYFNSYITRGAPLLNSVNPYLDTLNFRTFPNYTVEINGVPKTISYMLSLTPDNVKSFSIGSKSDFVSQK